MKDYSKILVFENDHESQGLNMVISKIKNSEDVPFEVWWQFNGSLMRDLEDSLERIQNIDTNTVVLANPSFVGAENSLSGYIILMMKLKELGKRLDIAIVYQDGFLKYLKDEYIGRAGNDLKKENNERLLREVLDFHNVYEIDYEDIRQDGRNILNSSKLILFTDNSPEYYIDDSYLTEPIKYVYHLQYNKHFKLKTGESKTSHDRISLSQEKLLKFVEEFCKEHELEMVRGTRPGDEYIFKDGDFAYEGKSDYLDVRFLCTKTDLL